eukprot:gene8493-9400_t
MPWFTLSKISRAFGASRWTVYRRLEEYNLHNLQHFSDVSDEEIDQSLLDFMSRHGNATGEPYMSGYLRSKGLLVQRRCVRASLNRINPTNVALRWRTLVTRRTYYVPWPNSLWHMDGHHSLIRWKFVIHGHTVSKAFSGGTQVQMHAAAKEMDMKMARKAPEDFGPTFQYHTIYYAQDNDVHMTVEKYIPGVFQKDVNNNGLIGTASKDYEEVYQKAKCLCHFSYIESKNELMVLDLQGCMYELFDPEIASSVLHDSEGSEETNFCAGNLSMIATDAFSCGNKCNKFFNMLNLPATNTSLESKTKSYE